VIAVLSGLGAALGFAGATLCYSRSTRMIGPFSVLSWVMLVGLAIVGPVVAARGVPDQLGAASVGWLAVSGGGNVGGLLLAYNALRTGKVAIVAPILSTEGAIAALISLGAGDGIATSTAVTLGVIAVGIVLASTVPSEDNVAAQRGRSALLSIGAAVCFGFSLYATGHVAKTLPVVWALLPARLIGVGLIALPLGVANRLRLTRRAAPLLITAGVGEVAGFALFAIGARHGLAVSAVLSSQFAALAAVAAFFLFHERLARVQLAGVSTIAVGVAVLSTLQG
jgi:uncharacterized membrane protein